VEGIGYLGNLDETDWLGGSLPDMAGRGCLASINLDLFAGGVCMPPFKKTEEDVKRDVTRLKTHIERLKQAANERGKAFASLSEESLVKKVRGETAKSPFMYAQSWTSGAFPGANANVTLYLHNPDPVGYFPFYVSIFFGLGSLTDIGDAWDGRDDRFPAFSSARADFLANTDQSFSFDYVIPTGLPLGTYNGNSVVWVGDWFGTGTVFDRGTFDLQLL
jgi:hypothetical protein